MGNWIKTSDRLPQEGKYVIGRHNRGTWHDSRDQENVNTVVVILVKGISIIEREQLTDDQLKRTYSFSDQYGNNKVPYAWDTFGPDSFNGQEIFEWAPIPD